MSEVIIKDDRKIIRVADGKSYSEVTYHKNRIAISAGKIEIESGD